MVGSWRATTDKSGNLNAARKKIVDKVKGRITLHAEDITVWNFYTLAGRKPTVRVAIGFMAKREGDTITGSYYVYKTIPGVDLGVCHDDDPRNCKPITSYGSAKKVAERMMLRG